MNDTNKSDLEEHRLAFLLICVFLKSSLERKDPVEAYGFYNSSNVLRIKCELGGVGIHFVHLL